MDATLEELCKGELRSGVGERGWHRVACAAKGLCFTEVFMNTKWNCAPEGVLVKHKWKNSEMESLEAWCVGGTEHSGPVCAWRSQVRPTGKCKTELRLRTGHGT